MVAKTDEAIRKSPVAKVDGEKITKAQLDERMGPVKANYVSQYGAEWESNSQAKAAYDEQKKQTRDDMVKEVLILQHAKSAKAIPTDKAINDEFKTKYDANVKQLGDETKLVAYLKQYGYTKDSYTTYLKHQIKVSQSIDLLMKDVKVDDAEVQKEYDTNKNIKYTTDPNYTHIMHILVATEAEANAVIARLNKGEDFATVAKEVSTDTGSKESGGDLGNYYLDESRNPSPLDADFLKGANAVAVGKISPPVKTTYGYHVIKVTERTSFQPKSFADAKADIKTSLLSDKKTKLLTADLAKWKKSLGKKIKTYDKNL